MRLLRRGAAFPLGRPGVRRAGGALLLAAALAVPGLLLAALVVWAVTFSWSISPEFAWTWGLVSVVVVGSILGCIRITLGRRSERLPRSVRRLIRRAEGGQRAAMAELAHRYAEGRDGLPRDPLQAACWWRRLAEAGDPEGAFRWGTCLYRGDGVLRDRQKGEAWLAAAGRTPEPPNG